jgi:DNA replication protein
MKRFGGFPPKMRFTAVPGPFFSEILPVIDDLTELKVILVIFHLLYPKKGYPRFITDAELLNDPVLLLSLGSKVESAKDILTSALERAVEQGIILRQVVTSGDETGNIYLLNSESDKEVITKLRSGIITLPGIKVNNVIKSLPPEPMPDIFSFYEENIGMITPLIAEEIRAAQKAYPESWLNDAVREAANQNKRKWSYISAILERWSSEGKTDGTYRRNSKKSDPDKYIKGKYGHMVQR